MYKEKKKQLNCTKNFYFFKLKCKIKFIKNAVNRSNLPLQHNFALIKYLHCGYALPFSLWKLLYCIKLLQFSLDERERGWHLPQGKWSSSFEYHQSIILPVATIKCWGGKRQVWVSHCATGECLFWGFLSSSYFPVSRLWCWKTGTGNRIPLKWEWQSGKNFWTLPVSLANLQIIPKGQHLQQQSCFVPPTESFPICLIFSNNYHSSCCAGPVNLR